MCQKADRLKEKALLSSAGDDCLIKIVTSELKVVTCESHSWIKKCEQTTKANSKQQTFTAW